MAASLALSRKRRQKLYTLINLKIQNSHNVVHNVENKVPIIGNFLSRVASAVQVRGNPALATEIVEVVSLE